MLTVRIESLGLVVALIYKPPDAGPREFIEQVGSIESCLDSLGGPVPGIILLGDFILLHMGWRWLGSSVVAEGSTGDASDEQLHKGELFGLCNGFSLSQQIARPTKKKMNELLFLNSVDLVCDITN